MRKEARFSFYRCNFGNPLWYNKPCPLNSKFIGRWLAYERDVVADYRAAFGEDPPPISGVGLMTDADDTGESALAYYGDIALSRAPATTAPAP